MNNISIVKGEKEDRENIAKNLKGLEYLSDKVKENIITAWVTSIHHSTFKDITEIPYSLKAPIYKLVDHVNEVTELGIKIYDFFGSNWNQYINKEDLIATLILHDVDKPMLITIENGNLVSTKLYKEVMHGVLGSYILFELGFPPQVVYSVASHSIDSPLHGFHPIDMILHYADLISADYAIMKNGGVPYFHRKILH